MALFNDKVAKAMHWTNYIYQKTKTQAKVSFLPIDQKAAFTNASIFYITIPLFGVQSYYAHRLIICHMFVFNYL